MKAMKQILLKQYQDIVDQAARSVSELPVPQEGWIRTMRNALGMSGAQLARKLLMSRAQVSQAERNELSGAITLKSLQKMADAMGSRVVYAFVPELPAGKMVEQRTRDKAKQLVSKADTHMALEKQRLSGKDREFEIKRLQRELLQKMPLDLWDDV